MKTRLDVLLVSRGLCESREKAKIEIMLGNVFVNGERIDKAGTNVAEDCAIEVRGSGAEFVSRGGKKLKKAVELYGLDLSGCVCADIGASTGGFTDCMLQHGAEKVYAIDVGYGQLAWKLRTDPRVINLERTNIRYLTEEQVPEKLDFFSVDVSFISLRLVLPVAAEFTSDSGEGVCLIKPQFEAGKERVGKKGVVRDPAVHVDVIDTVCSYITDAGFNVKALTFSPIKGPEGNIEYLAYVSKKPCEAEVFDVAALVKEAHTALGG